jgi:hypothetical protein
MPLDVSLRQWPFLMSASVVEGKERALYIEWELVITHTRLGLISDNGPCAGGAKWRSVWECRLAICTSQFLSL